MQVITSSEYFNAALEHLNGLQRMIVRGIETNINSSLVSKLACDSLENNIPQLRAILLTIIDELK